MPDRFGADPPGATPITDEEEQGLIPAWVATHADLNEVNIGIDPSQISIAVADLVADAGMWLASTSIPMDQDEIALTVHHRMVAIHPFPNGNGRHAREYADLLLRSIERPPFTWGRASLAADPTVRAAYIDGLRAADRGDYGPLRGFVRS